jgi:predicted branched-subunit amino acid permease
LCTTAGALAGSVITDIRALGFDFALGAMFAALLVLQIAGRQTRLPAVAAASVGALVALVGTLVVPASWAIVAATIIAATVGMVAEEKAGPA